MAYSRKYVAIVSKVDKLEWKIAEIKQNSYDAYIALNAGRITYEKYNKIKQRNSVKIAELTKELALLEDECCKLKA